MWKDVWFKGPLKHSSRHIIPKLPNISCFTYWLLSKCKCFNSCILAQIFHPSNIFSILHLSLHSVLLLYHLIKLLYSVPKSCLMLCYVRILFILFLSPRNHSYHLKKFHSFSWSISSISFCEAFSDSPNEMESLTL